MAKFPMLTKMGIENPEEISAYTLSQIDDSDHLRISYSRKKYSIRPISKRFVFGRFQNTMVVDSGKPAIENVNEISPQLLEAIAELDQIVKSDQKASQSTASLKQELARLEDELSSNLASVRSLLDSIEKLKSSTG
ncbi:MAG: DUF3461 family protein [Gammaproteobacteria bacterium]|nr:DUF3461 family protein [Gammaproteobacteria bacterium]